jgi:hypothetical protein
MAKWAEGNAFLLVPTWKDKDGGRLVMGWGYNLN